MEASTMVSIHRFAKVGAHLQVIVLVGTDEIGAFAVMLNLDGAGRPIELTALATMNLATAAHRLTADVFVACHDELDTMAAIARVSLGLFVGPAWAFRSPMRLYLTESGHEHVGTQVAIVRGPSVRALYLAAGYCDGAGEAHHVKVTP